MFHHTRRAQALLAGAVGLTLVLGVGVAVGAVPRPMDTQNAASVKSETVTPEALSGKGIVRLTADDCSPKPAAPWDQSRYELGENWPMFLPDGRHFLYGALRGDKKHDIFWTSLDSGEGGSSVV